MEQRGPRRYALTGGTGLIGSRVGQRLIERGDDVTFLVRDASRAARQLPFADDFVEWDATMEEGAWIGRIDGSTGVINLAGANIGQRWSPSRKAKIESSRIDGTRNLVQAIKSARVRPDVLLNGSAMGYYDAHEPGMKDEWSKPGDDFVSQLAVRWEAEAQAAESSETRVLLLRTTFVASTQGGGLPRMITPFKFFVGGPIGIRKWPWPWIHIDDLVRMILHLLDNTEVSGPIIAGSPSVPSNREFSSALGRALHRPSWLPVPYFALKILFGEAADTIAHPPAVYPKRAMEIGFEFEHPDVDEALRDIIEKNL